MRLNFPSLILASGSPRRRSLFQTAGFDVSFAHPDVAETFSDTLPPAEVPSFLALQKSMAVNSPLLVVTADTVVVIDGEILNKPIDASEAKWMLNKLRGRSHEVYTGVCMRKGEIQHCFTEQTTVTMSDYTDAFIEQYIASGAPFDKAGGYGIQDAMGLFGVKHISGCFYNVMGFPMARFYEELSIFLRKNASHFEINDIFKNE